MIDKLEFFIVTYNRADYLRKTLDYLSKSYFNRYPITILNNCSTDKTENIYTEFICKFSNLRLITHPINIGACANIVRSLEISKSLYTWILCDDDDFNFTDIDDLLQAINEAKVDLIHAGAHPDNNRFQGGLYLTPQELLKNGYHYFKYGSFIPCNIFRTELAQQLITEAYNNISNGYPHFPYLVKTFLSNQPIYVTKKQIVTAKTTGQFYDKSRWLIWWMNSCKILVDFTKVRTAFFDHFEASSYNTSLYELITESSTKNNEYHKDISIFIKYYFTSFEKLMLNRKIRYIIGLVNRIKNKFNIFNITNLH